MARRYIGKGVHQMTGKQESLSTFAATGTLNAYGINQIIGHATPINYTLPAPARGRQVVIACGFATSSATCTVIPASGVYFASSGTTVSNLRKLTFNGANDTVTLVGLSTVRWLITSNVGSVAVATT